jgi:hypothetical protein
MASMAVCVLVELFDREPSCRGAIRAELTRRWSGAAQLRELGRSDVIDEAVSQGSAA